MTTGCELKRDTDRIDCLTHGVSVSRGKGQDFVGWMTTYRGFLKAHPVVHTPIGCTVRKVADGADSRLVCDNCGLELRRGGMEFVAWVEAYGAFYDAHSTGTVPPQKPVDPLPPPRAVPLGRPKKGPYTPTEASKKVSTWAATVRSYDGKQARAMRERDDAMRAMRDEGASLEDIGKVAKLTKQAVDFILRRDAEEAAF